MFMEDENLDNLTADNLVELATHMQREFDEIILEGKLTEEQKNVLRAELDETLSEMKSLHDRKTEIENDFVNRARLDEFKLDSMRDVRISKDKVIYAGESIVDGIEKDYRYVGNMIGDIEGIYRGLEYFDDGQKYRSVEYMVECVNKLISLENQYSNILNTDVDFGSRELGYACEQLQCGNLDEAMYVIIQSKGKMEEFENIQRFVKNEVAECVYEANQSDKYLESAASNYTSELSSRASEYLSQNELDNSNDELDVAGGDIMTNLISEGMVTFNISEIEIVTLDIKDGTGIKKITTLIGNEDIGGIQGGYISEEELRNLIDRAVSYEKGLVIDKEVVEEFEDTFEKDDFDMSM